jgi:hypothetical protein
MYFLLQEKFFAWQCDKVNDDFKIFLCSSAITFYLNKNTVIKLYKNSCMRIVYIRTIKRTLLI